MTIRADSKKRVVMPDAHPGDVFAYEDHGNGHFHLVRLNMPGPPKRMTRAQVRKAIANSKLKFELCSKLTKEEVIGVLVKKKYGETFVYI